MSVVLKMTWPEPPRPVLLRAEVSLDKVEPLTPACRWSIVATITRAGLVTHSNVQLPFVRYTRAEAYDAAVLFLLSSLGHALVNVLDDRDEEDDAPPERAAIHAPGAAS